MISGMLARKIGMSQVFQDDGTMVPVTVLQVGPMTVTQKKNKDRDGYDGVQLGFEEIAERKLNRPTKGHLKGQTSVRILREFRAEDHDAVTVGQKFDHSIFSEGELVSVVGTSKGRGFAGVMKRHGFGGQPASHVQPRQYANMSRLRAAIQASRCVLQVRTATLHPPLHVPMRSF